MKITIDTKEDSVQDIKKAISFLQNIIDEQSFSSPAAVPEEPQINPGLIGMFDNEQPTNQFSDEPQSTPTVSAAAMDMFDAPMTNAESQTAQEKSAEKTESDEPFTIQPY